ncbi:hypothetical protein OEZ49_11165 [Ruegeria sp. WL0004]|uniref:Lipoprotein n=2 Tax=Ruegeria TaxID=97050 RepID=A0ABT2WRN7_9RHOB|nr:MULTISPECIES: hypothetical protein [unclassified Ruegeria]MCU9838327.1 hypothetical protein [Ruegeria sp. WL0004]MCV2888197.1 hypothetical protein [Ruegeria sp. XHP0148]
MRRLARCTATLLALTLLAGCLPTGDGIPAGASPDRYERAKANRDSYMYQGI